MVEAKITTYGGEEALPGFRTIQHWQLIVDDQFVADTDVPHVLAMFEKIAEKLNA